MALASNIARRPGSAVYYARLGVPPDLQAIMKKKELWKSLAPAGAARSTGEGSAGPDPVASQLPNCASAVSLHQTIFRARYGRIINPSWSMIAGRATALPTDAVVQDATRQLQRRYRSRTGPVVRRSGHANERNPPIMVMKDAATWTARGGRAPCLGLRSIWRRARRP